jgi:hypothetical protein
MVLNACADIALALFAPHGASPHPQPGGPAFSPTVIAVHVVLLGMTLFGFFTVWAYWRGRSWARWLVFGGCIFYLTGLRLLPSQWHHHPPYGAALTVFAAVLSIFLLWYLYTLDVRIWFARSLGTSPTNK